MNGKKILLITNIPNPYRLPLFNTVHRLFREKGLQLKVIFGAPGYSRRKFSLDPSEFGFDYEILDDRGHTFSADGEKTIFMYRGLGKVLNRERPDLVIVSGFSPATVKVVLRKLFKGTPYIIYSGTINAPGRKESVLRCMQRKLICKFASAFVTYGNLASGYIAEKGVDPSSIFIARNTVDTRFFETKTAYMRDRLKENGPARFLYLGYLVPRKNVQLLLETVRRIATRRRDFRLDIIGDGISLGELKEFTSAHNLNDIVAFHGYRQKEALPEFFASSRALLFQTDFDIWGLVLNEAMAAGLPCVASVNAGATTDLVVDGVNGFAVDFKDHDAVAEKMEWLIANPVKASEMGKKANAFIHEHASLDLAAENFLKAVSHALNKK